MKQIKARSECSTVAYPFLIQRSLAFCTVLVVFSDSSKMELQGGCPITVTHSLHLIQQRDCASKTAHNSSCRGCAITVTLHPQSSLKFPVRSAIKWIAKCFLWLTVLSAYPVSHSPCRCLQPDAVSGWGIAKWLVNITFYKKQKQKENNLRCFRSSLATHLNASVFKFFCHPLWKTRYKSPIWHWNYLKLHT